MAERMVNIMIGGAAGQGLVTVGQLLAKSLIRAGYEIVVRQDYMSRVRGGHNTFSIRTGTCPIKASSESVDILVAMNQETITLHSEELADDGLIFCDTKLDRGDAAGLALPLGDLAPKPIFQNVAALGVLASALGIDQSYPAQLLADTFGKKGEAIVQQNQEVLAAAYEWMAGQGVDFEPLPEAPERAPRMMIQGNEAIAFGALAAGCNFCSFYPMTPATSIAQNLISHGPEMGAVVEQVEDEIAAMNMGIGASFAGARAIVPTSGGGFALMTEAVSLAAVSETPIVCALAMRPGPATGLPTRTEQADLNLVLYAGHGEYPRAIFAPGDVKQCFELAHKSFDIAEKYQSPVFLLTDQYLADSYRGVEPFDGRLLPEPTRPLLQWEGEGEYERYAFTESGVSPRLIPGFGEHTVLGDSHEHLEDGHITEDIDIRIGMKDKRLKKGEGMRDEAIAPAWYGDDAPDLLLVNWGSTMGPVEEAVDVLAERGIKAASMHFSQVWPLNAEQFLAEFQTAGKVVCVESNALGQFAAVLRQETGFTVDAKVLKYDGRPFTAQNVVDSLEQQGLV